MKILNHNLESGLLDKPSYRRLSGVLLTARALELEKVDRDLARDSVMEAVKLAPTLVPAAVLAAKFESEAHQVRSLDRRGCGVVRRICARARGTRADWRRSDAARRAADGRD